QKPDEHINQTAESAAATATTVTAAAIRLAATDARERIGGEEREAEHSEARNQNRGDETTRYQTLNLKSQALHFNSMRGPSTSSLGFSPVAGKFSARTFPKLRRYLISFSGSHRFAICFNS